MDCKVEKQRSQKLILLKVQTLGKTKHIDNKQTTTKTNKEETQITKIRNEIDHKTTNLEN